MNSYTKKIITRRSIEYSMEIGADGLPWIELYKLWQIIMDEADKRGKPASNDMVKVFVGDDTVIFRIDLEVTTEPLLRTS